LVLPENDELRVWEREYQEDEDEAFAEGGDEHELEQNVLNHIATKYVLYFYNYINIANNFRQVSHGRVIAQNYAVDSKFLKSLSGRLIKAFEHVSILWHRLFEEQIGSRGLKHSREASNQLTLRKRERTGTVDRAPQEEARVDKASWALQCLLGPTAHYRSEGQRSAMELLHN
jgi:hypothetical protein